MASFHLRRMLCVSLSGTIGCIIGGGLVACAPTPDASKAYPMSPPSATPPPATMPSAATLPIATIKVPPDAVELSNGDYPPPAFPEPSQPGLLMVVDLNADPTVAVASTAVTGKDAGKMMSITDVANMSITMDKTHKYRILFKPEKATTTP